MNRITRIIENTFESILTDYKSSKANCENLEIKLHETQTALKESNQQLGAFEELKENFRQLKSDYEDVVQIKNHFYHNILRKKHFINELTEKQQILKQENEKLRSEAETKCFISNERDFWKKRFEDLRAEGETLKFQCEHLKVKICKSENEIDNWSALLENMDLKISRNSEKFEATSKICEGLHNRVQVAFIRT